MWCRCYKGERERMTALAATGDGGAATTATLVVVFYALERILLYSIQVCVCVCVVALDLLSRSTLFLLNQKSTAKLSMCTHMMFSYLTYLPTYLIYTHIHFIIIMSIFHFAILKFASPSSFSSSSIFFMNFSSPSSSVAFDIIIVTVRAFNMCVYWKCAFIALIPANVSVLPLSCVGLSMYIWVFQPSIKWKANWWQAKNTTADYRLAVKKWRWVAEKSSHCKCVRVQHSVWAFKLFESSDYE